MINDEERLNMLVHAAWERGFAYARREGAMKWTSEKPTEPGMYWFKNDHRLEIVEIHPGHKWGELASAYYEGGEFQGPITPQEAQ